MANCSNGMNAHQVRPTILRARDQATLRSVLAGMVAELFNSSPDGLIMPEGQKKTLEHQIIEEAVRQAPRWLSEIAFACLLGTCYRRYVHAFFRQRVCCLSTAEDLTQQTILKALNAIRSGHRLPDRPKAWLRTIARNVATDRQRHQFRRKEVCLDSIDESSLPEVTPSAAGNEGAAREALGALERQLGPTLAELVRLRLDGCTNAAIADRKGVRKRTVERWWETVRNILR
jgi:RNA polymerase sigma factor (sigma-70 family)